MAQELERKFLVSPEEFDRCLAHMATRSSGEPPYVQVNYYFDTPDHALYRVHAMLRVRRKEDRLLLQYKHARTVTDSLFCCNEEEAPLSEFPNVVNPKDFFPEAPDCSCLLQGDLVTLRRDFCFPSAVVSFDENIYFGHRDFEIEIEGESAAIEELTAFLSPRPLGESKGKRSRFLKRLHEIVNR